MAKKNFTYNKDNLINKNPKKNLSRKSQNLEELQLNMFSADDDASTHNPPTICVRPNHTCLLPSITPLVFHKTSLFFFCRH